MNIPYILKSLRIPCRGVIMGKFNVLGTWPLFADKSTLSTKAFSTRTINKTLKTNNKNVYVFKSVIRNDDNIMNSKSGACNTKRKMVVHKVRNKL